MLRLNFDIAGEQQYSRAFEAFEHETRDMTEPFTQIAKDLVQAVGQQFETEGSHGTGAKWKDLNTAYEKWKDEHYPGRPILVRTAAMRQAYLLQGTRELTHNTLVWGITDQTNKEGQLIAEYAGAHQTGEGHMPQRKMVALTQAERRGFDRVFVEWLNGIRHRMIGA